MARRRQSTSRFRRSINRSATRISASDTRPSVLATAPSNANSGSTNPNGSLLRENRRSAPTSKACPIANPISANAKLCSSTSPIRKPTIFPKTFTRARTLRLRRPPLGNRLPTQSSWRARRRARGQRREPARELAHVGFGQRTGGRAHHRDVARTALVRVQRVQQIIVLLAREIRRTRNARVAVLAVTGRAQAQARGPRHRRGVRADGHEQEERQANETHRHES